MTHRSIEQVIDQKWKEAEKEVRDLQNTLTDHGAVDVTPIHRMKAALRGLGTMQVLGKFSNKGKDPESVLRAELESVLAKVEGMQLAFNKKEELWNALLGKKNEQLMISMKREQTATSKLRDKVNEVNQRLRDTNDHITGLDKQLAESHEAMEAYEQALGYKLHAIKPLEKPLNNDDFLKDRKHISQADREANTYDAQQMIRMQDEANKLAGTITSSYDIDITIGQRGHSRVESASGPQNPVPDSASSPQDSVASLLTSKGVKELLSQVMLESAFLPSLTEEESSLVDRVSNILNGRTESPTPDPPPPKRDENGSNNLRLVAAALEFRVLTQKNKLHVMHGYAPPHNVDALSSSSKGKSTHDKGAKKVAVSPSRGGLVGKDETKKPVTPTPAQKSGESVRTHNNHAAEENEKQRLKLFREKREAKQEADMLQVRVEKLLEELSSLKPCEFCGRVAIRNNKGIQSSPNISKVFGFNTLSSLPILVNTKGHILRDAGMIPQKPVYQERMGGGGAAPRRQLPQ